MGGDRGKMVMSGECKEGEDDNGREEGKGRMEQRRGEVEDRSVEERMTRMERCATACEEGRMTMDVGVRKGR